VTHDGRFAPSPTGPLHLGSLRTALVAWLFARTQSARFLVRIEDLDTQRSSPEHEQSQLADLRALGIDWDGPVVRQSERMPLYARALSDLQRQGTVYPCFCTRAEIREAASAPHGRSPEGAYPGTCSRLTAEEQSRRIAAGRRYALRVRANGERIEFDDRLHGRVGTIVDDFVVRRADGVPAYQLAVVVDDADQGIGEVVRGADLADSTPRQILLARLLGLPVPSYAHVPLVLAPDGARLAKRDHRATLADRDEPVSATLSLLAQTLGLTTPGSTASELLDEFDPARIPLEPVMIETGPRIGVRTRPSSSTMRDRLRSDLTAALKARDRTAVSALRSAIAALDNAEAVDLVERGTQPAAASSHIAGASAGAGSADVPRRTLTDDEIEAIVAGQIEERRQAAREYAELGRTDAAERLNAEADILTHYL
jgi:glutamyl-tRNA synthetase